MRLFVALDLPEPVREEVEAWRREVLTDPALRHNAGLRVVLLFLGHRPARDVPYYLETIRGLCAAAPAPLIQLDDAVPKGPGGRPRLFALPAKSREAEVLHIGLRSYFAKRGLVFHEPEQRPFWPHVTVARVRTEKDESRRPELVQTCPTLGCRQACGNPSKGKASVSTGLKCEEPERAMSCWAKPICRGRPLRLSTLGGDDGRAVP